MKTRVSFDRGDFLTRSLVAYSQNSRSSVFETTKSISKEAEEYAPRSTSLFFPKKFPAITPTGKEPIQSMVHPLANFLTSTKIFPPSPKTSLSIVSKTKTITSISLLSPPDSVSPEKQIYESYNLVNKS